MSTPRFSQASPSVRNVFVYGTLRAGQLRDINLLKPTPRFIAVARLHATLFDLGPYPGLRLGTFDGRWPSDSHAPSVLGEIYEINPALERVLDEIEELWPVATGEYHKREVVATAVDRRVAAGPGAPTHEVQCFVYEISEARIAGKPMIPGGDWQAHVR
jgi:gamma-glutamylcyclotransferase (GGCT)/AIG2-like uncharacterized protein YtfP